MLDDQDQAACYEEQPVEAFVPIYDQEPPRWMTEKVVARLKHIEDSELPADWKRDQIELTLRNAEHWDSITKGGTYNPASGKTTGSGRQPYWPTMEDIKAW